MMTFTVYLLGLVDTLKDIAVPVWIMLVVFGIIALVAKGVERLDSGTDNRSCGCKVFADCKYMLVRLAIVLFLVSLIPNSKTIAAMYLVPRIANSELVQKVPEQLSTVLQMKLDGWIKELSKEQTNNTQQGR
jgi:hypothetical protein